MTLNRGLGWAAGAVLAGAILVGAACVSQTVELPSAPVAQGSGITVQAAPVPLDPADPAKTAIGDFRYAGGLVLTSPDTSRLHGLSDMVVQENGGLLVVSDDGDRLFGSLVLDAAGRVTGLAHANLEPLTGLDGKPLQSKAEGDAESLTLLDDGPMLVGFERQHRIWAYPESDAEGPKAAPMPAVAMADNDGMEGLAAAPSVGPDAYWVGIEPGGIWLCRLRTSCKAVEGLPTPPVGFRLSSLSTGPDGELVILHHSFIPGIGSRIILTVVRDPLGAKAVIGKMAMGPNATVDNFEGVSVVRKVDGTWRLYLLSDDNFNPAQRTILLAFDWTPPK